MNQHPLELIPNVGLGDHLSTIFPSALDPEALWVVRRLRKNGHAAHFVGGCVRDLLLGKLPKDFDIATSARPRQIKKVFRNSRIIGRRFRLVHVHFDGGKVIEVSTFRKDPREESKTEFSEDESPGSSGDDLPAELRDDDVDWEAESDADGPGDLLIKEDNVFGSEKEDALRRDFTINALFFDSEQNVILDYVGGVEDLRKRVLKTIGNASTRLREDPVRILRAVKFATRHGLYLDPELAAAMAEYHGDLLRSSPPRVCEEMLRMIGGVHPAKSFEILARLGILWVLMPELGIRPHDESNPRLDKLLRRLQVLSSLDHGMRSFSTANYFALLLFDITMESMRGDSDRQGPDAADEVLRPFALRYRVSRRDLARMRSAFLALRRIDPVFGSGKSRRKRNRVNLRDFLQREYFRDALLLFRIISESEGRDADALARWERTCADHQIALPYPAIGEALSSEPITLADRPPDTGVRRRRRRRRRKPDSRIEDTPADEFP